MKQTNAFFLITLLLFSASTFAVDSWAEMDSRSEDNQEEMVEITKEKKYTAGY